MLTIRDAWVTAFKYLLGDTKQGVIATACGLSPGMLTKILKYEYATTTGSDEYRQKIAEYFGLDIVDMLALGKKLLTTGQAEIPGGLETQIIGTGLSQVPPRTLFDVIPDAALVADTQAQIVDVSRSASLLYRVPREELIGKQLWTWFQEADVSGAQYRFDQALEQEASRSRARIRRGDGTWIYIERLFFPVVVEDKVVAVLAIDRDISAEIHAEEMHRQQIVRLVKKLTDHGLDPEDTSGDIARSLPLPRKSAPFLSPRA